MRDNTRDTINAALQAGGMGEKWAEDLAPKVAAAAFWPFTPVLTVYSKSVSRWFNVRFIPEGMDAYPGQKHYPLRDGPEKPAQVEFYDATYADDDRFYRGLGQFTGGSYHVATILGEDGYGQASGGIDLMGHVDVWKVDAAAMLHVRDWLRMVRDAGPLPKIVATGRA